MTSDAGNSSPSRRGLLKVAATLAAATVEPVVAKAAVPAEGAGAMDWSAREAVDHIKKGDISAEAYVGELLKHHDAHRNLNCFITLDEDRVKREARAVDQARAKGQKLGALAGLPVVIKDQIDVQGYPTTVGSKILKGYVAKKNAVVVDALINNGAVIMAKTSMSDLITGSSTGRYYPAPRNPYDLSRVTGGSSTGVGAALGARIAPAGIGEDSAGSVRWPAAFCGVSGLRPSTYAIDNLLNGKDRKRYPGLGMVLPTSWMDTMGPMARTVSDVAFLDAAITGEATPKADLRKVKIGIPRADYWDKRPHDPKVRQVIEGNFAKLKAAGAQLVDVDLNGLIELSAQDRLSPAVQRGAMPTEQWLAENLPSLSMKELEAERHKNSFTQVPKNYYRLPAPPAERPMLSLDDAKKLAAEAWAAYQAPFTSLGVTAIAGPTINILPNLINFHWNNRDQKIFVNGEWVEEWDLILTNIWWGSRFGAPCLSLPAGMADGLPVGFHLQGLPGADTTLLGLGMEIEKVLGPVPPPTFKHVAI